MSNQALPGEGDIIEGIERTLVSALPSGWSLEAKLEVPVSGGQLDLLIKVTAPNGESADLLIEVERTIEPSLAPQVVERLERYCSGKLSHAVPVAAASQLSPQTREVLEGAGIAYVDMSGNMRIEVFQPGLFIATS